MNFQSYESCSRPTSRVLRPPGGGLSNIFGTPDPPAPINKKEEVAKVEVNPVEPAKVEQPEEVSTTNVRRNPITGDVIENTESSKANKEGKENNKEAEDTNAEDPLKKYEPHLGDQRNFSGTRVAQPPGGRSNITFG